MASGVETLYVAGQRLRVETHVGGGERELRIPFQPGTYEIKEGLKACGWRCVYQDKYWVYKLREGDTGAQAKQGVRELLAPPTPQQERKRRRDDDEQEEAAASQPELKSFHGGAVTMACQADGFVVLQGATLRRIRPMLQNIFHFQRAAGEVECWRSGWPLTRAEQSCVQLVLEHRREKLLHGVDDRQPFPPGAIPVPRSFLPLCHGQPMRGPFKSGANAKPWNVGRQFFTSGKRDWDLSGFLWADGVEPFSEEAQRRAFDMFMDELGWLGGELWDGGEGFEEQDGEEWEGDEDGEEEGEEEESGDEEY